MKINELIKNKVIIKSTFMGIYIIFIIIMIIIYFKILEKSFDIKMFQEAENTLNIFKIILNNPKIIVIFLVISLIVFLSYINIKYFFYGKKEENEGISFKRKDGTHGTASFVEPKELDRILKIGNEENINGIILGKTLDTNEIIIMPDSLKTLNRNIIIFGASGSGKSRKFIIPNILKIAEQDEKEKEIHKNVSQGKNFVCTDPKGELYSKTCKMLEKRGYKVKLLNLVNPLYSDGIDLIKFIEEKVDAQVFAQVVMSATQNVGTKKRR